MKTITFKIEVKKMRVSDSKDDQIKMVEWEKMSHPIERMAPSGQEGT